MLLLWPSTDLDDVSCSVFSLHTFLLACLLSGKLCEATLIDQNLLPIFIRIPFQLKTENLTNPFRFIISKVACL